MGIITHLLSSAPVGFWPNIINFFSNLVHNYAFGIILLTLVIKIVMLPVDFINRKVTLKNTEITRTLQPEMNRIKTTYKDPQVQNAKIKELYDKNHFNPLGLCGPMLVCFALSIVIFFTLFSGLNSMANYKIVNQYEQLQTSYISVINDSETSLSAIDAMEDKTEEEKAALKNELIISWVKEINMTENESLKAEAQRRVNEKYSEIKDSFLWIKNVWVADVPWAKAIPDFNSYAKLAKLTDEEKTNEDTKNSYEAVMLSIESSNSVNGFLLLTILTVGATVLTQWLNGRNSKKKQELNAQNQVNPNKGMMIIFPLIMGIFTLMYNSVFSLYILVGQLFSIATTPLITKIIEIIDNKKEQKKLNNSNRMKRI